jgi:penicillin-binding protein 1A
VSEVREPIVETSVPPGRMAARAERVRHYARRARDGARRAWAVVAPLLGRSAVAVGRRVRFAWSHRAVRIGAAVAAALVLLPPGWLAYHVYWDRSNLPAIDPFIRFEPPTIGEIYDARGTVLIQLAREYRRIVTYDEIPLVLRQAIMSAEDKNFDSHCGVEYGALPRVIEKTVVRSAAGWWRGKGMRLLMPQGGSTITQQLVRVYFLPYLTSRKDDDAVFSKGFGSARILAAFVGAPAANKLLRKLEEVRLALWLEEAMERYYGSRKVAKEQIFSRYASFIYMGSGRYGFGAASEYYFDKPLTAYTQEDAGKAALLAGIAKSPHEYAPAPRDLRPLYRRNQILDLMARNGYISQDLASSAEAAPVHVARHAVAKTQAPAAVDNVLDEVRDRGGESFNIAELFQGRILVHSTIDARLQTIVNDALEKGLAAYEKRHPKSKGFIQGSAVVLGNADAAILAEVGGRQIYKLHYQSYSDYNRVTGSLRQPGSAMKPLVYLAALRSGLRLDTLVPDEPIAVPMGSELGVKWIVNYDNRFKGPIPMRQALAESRNAVAIWLTRQIGLDKVLQVARELGIHTPLQPYITTALGASEVRLLELAGVYRAMASGVLAEPHVVARVTDPLGVVLYTAPAPAKELDPAGLREIQEGLRGVVRLPDGTAHGLDCREFPIPVMGKTGTTSEFRDALFVGSTYGPQGITVAVRIGFDDNQSLGEKETGGRTALPVFHDIVLRAYKDGLVGEVPKFPREIEQGIDEYLLVQAALIANPAPVAPRPLDQILAAPVPIADAAVGPASVRN